MKTTLSMAAFCALLAIQAWGASIIQIPLGNLATNTPFWITNPTQTNAPTGSQAWQAVVTNFNIVQGEITTLQGQYGSLPDTSTNAAVLSSRIATWMTNGTWSATATNYYPWMVTNPCGVTYTLTVGAADLYYSLDLGTNWVGYGAETLVTTGIVKYAWFPPSIQAMGTVLNPVVTNLIVYTLARPDKFGTTNVFYGQTVQVGSPYWGDDAASKSYVDGMVSSVSYGLGQLNGAPINQDNLWSISTTATATNEGTWVVSYAGAQAVSIIEPTASFASIKSVQIVNVTNVQVSVPTNGLASAPTMQITHILSPANWIWQTSTNWVSGTNYIQQFKIPFTDRCFIRAAIPSTLPPVLSLASVLSATPFTVTNATDSTYGLGAGLVRWDTNYCYISTGTNLWKRAALSSW